MKNHKLIVRLVHLLILLVLFACSEDDAKAGKSRDIKFEISGTFTGTLDATYITASGGGTNESITSLPWTKNIKYLSTTVSTSITVGGDGGVAGQTLFIKVFAGGTLVSETSGISNSSGILVVASPSYIF
ncbi:hypothetical protein SanaruYs_06750 [Chryseotalea sanaruensis]|uniref:Uncharacterized protein n=1 Tax=Chryseotalea sanaruensis TaxID=2482724 RepID=A0A401U6I9_9BACT|nr:hypothetical protein [Chryseotalea sanaruensis]GCC50460.1 hypothetical protein SanaruYs_06750 [Chryseotalea sanaruensis]